MQPVERGRKGEALGSKCERCGGNLKDRQSTEEAAAGH